MTTTTTPPVDVATILASVIRSSHPKLALPTIAANHDLSLRDLQHLLHQHGYPDKTRMREAWRKAVAGHDHELDAGVPVPTPAPAASGKEVCSTLRVSREALEKWCARHGRQAEFSVLVSRETWSEAS